jgi:hypothetical protein
MTDEAAMLNVEGRIERKKAYDELQALFACIYAVTGNRPEFYRTPPRVLLRPVGQNERRAVLREGDINVGKLVSSDGTVVDEIPRGSPGASDWPCILVKLDQGSIGQAGGSFVEGLTGDVQYLWHTTLDPCHRKIRDAAGTLKHAAGGIFQTMQVKSNHVFKLNYKPFNSGVWEKVKRGMLEDFLEVNTASSPIFLKWYPLLCEGFGVDDDGSEEMRERIFAYLQELPSIREKGPIAKMMRWFAWNECAKFHLPEWFAMGMLLGARR